METPASNLTSSSGRIGFRFRLREIIRAPVLAFLEQSGVFRTQSQPVSSSDVDIQRDNEVSIRIVGGMEEQLPPVAVAGGGDERIDDFSERGVEELRAAGGVNGDDEQTPAASNNNNNNNRYDIQNVAQWIEQILPFSLLLLVVLIRQHLQGFFGTIWISAVLFKSNDILQKQTALKGERKFLVLISITVIFMLHVVFVYWWYQNDDLMYPLVLLPPKSVPPFWHALFIILVNDSMARQAAMGFKCLLLMYYKNTGGHNYRKQVRLLVSALRALSCKELHYGSSASTEQVTAAGDLCAICQEKLRSPIVLRCKHIFCEECVSEWFDRERTCPLCRAVVKPADIKSYSDGSTSLFFQFF